MKYLSLLIIIVALLGKVALAEERYFLKVDGFPGISFQQDFTDYMEIEQFSYSATNNCTISNGIECGIGNIRNVSLTKFPDKNDVLFLQNLFTGASRPTAEIVTADIITNALETIGRVVLTNIAFTSFTPLTGSDGTTRLSVSLTFEQICVEAYEINQQGVPTVRGSTQIDRVNNVTNTSDTGGC